MFLLMCLLTLMHLCHAYTIQGSLTAPLQAPSDWVVHTRVHVDGGQYIGFVRQDGSFAIHGVPSGSYLVEFISPYYLFPPARVDINSKGKLRARRVNALQPNAVKTLLYPLRVASLGKTSYFQVREQLRTMDLLLNPTVLFMVVPLLLVMLLPKMLDTNDPELHKEMQQMNILNPKQSLPDMSELLSSISLFGGNSNSGKAGAKRGITSGSPAAQIPSKKTVKKRL